MGGMEQMTEEAMARDLLALAPEGALALAAILGLLLGSFLPRRKQWMVRILAAGGAIAVFATTLPVWHDESTLFDDSYAIDTATNAVRVVVAAAILLLLALSVPETRGHARESEYIVLLVLAGLGAILLAGANDLLVLIVAYLLAGIPLYALTAFGKDASGTEAALKYYLFGALSGTIMLFGAALVFGAGRATAYPMLAEAAPTAPSAALALGTVAVLTGLLFKAGAVPLHFWVPDVTQGTRPEVAALVTTVPKLGAVVAIYRLATTVLEPSALDWRLLLAVPAALTMTLGNFAAFFQTDVRRLLGYSTISQVGYLLVGVAAGPGPLALSGVLLYLAAYAVTNLGAFAVVCALPRLRALTDYAGLLRRRPALTIALIVCLLGLVGTPPTGIFVGKLAVFTAAMDAGLGWLVVLALLNTVASVFYYLRWITPALRGRATGESGDPALAVPRVIAYLAATVSVLAGVFAGPILNAVEGATPIR
ncbi:NADH-quinone oxidoreductase subunit N [Nocardia huaxiensis]|uniref:NADH-quinone oxidoreductase subunit N n=1 Tax=Nocardia huaxiensis TaxID=2755382 RepID=UPI001E46312D|nr:NADH-quinone oxidoreductase subunit N [Nocardia huaxiensis]UFS99148.1 NADH-quinone oxidoreductase subunit N [Nocardia huaxiensis]